MSALFEGLVAVLGMLMGYVLLSVIVGTLGSPLLVLAMWMCGADSRHFAPPPAPAPRLAPSATAASVPPPPDPLPLVCARCGARLAAPRMVVLHGRPYCEEHFAGE